MTDLADITPNDPQPHSIWLMPEPNAAARLRDLILRVSSTYDCPVFEPHITLLGDLHRAPILTIKACQKNFASMNPLQVTLTGVARSDQHFMALFLDATIKPDLGAIRGAIFETLTDRNPAPFRPHISLSYGLPQNIKIAPELSDKINDFVDTQIVFDKVHIVKSAKSIPVSEWTTVTEVGLKISC